VDEDHDDDRHPSETSIRPPSGVHWRFSSGGQWTKSGVRCAPRCFASNRVRTPRASRLYTRMLAAGSFAAPSVVLVSTGPFPTKLTICRQRRKRPPRR